MRTPIWLILSRYLIMGGVAWFVACTNESNEYPYLADRQFSGQEYHESKDKLKAQKAKSVSKREMSVDQVKIPEDNSTRRFQPSSPTQAIKKTKPNNNFFIDVDSASANQYLSPVTVNKMIFSIDGKFLITGTQKGVNVYDVKSKKLIKHGVDQKGHIKTITHLHNVGSNHFSFSTYGRKFQILNTKNWLLTDEWDYFQWISAYDYPYLQYSFERNGEQYFVWRKSYPQKNYIYIGNLSQSRMFHTIQVSRDIILDFQNNQSLNVISARDLHGQIYVWSINNGKNLINKKFDFGYIFDTALLPEKPIIALNTYAKIIEYNYQTNTVERTIQKPANVNYKIICGQGERFFILGHSTRKNNKQSKQNLMFYERKNSAIRYLPTDLKNSITHIAHHPSLSLVAAADKNGHIFISAYSF